MDGFLCQLRKLCHCSENKKSAILCRTFAENGNRPDKVNAPGGGTSSGRGPIIRMGFGTRQASGMALWRQCMQSPPSRDQKKPLYVAACLHSQPVILKGIGTMWMAGPTNFGNGMLSGGGPRGATDRARSIAKTFNLTTNGCDSCYNGRKHVCPRCMS